VTEPPASPDRLAEEGAATWLLRCARELDDAILHLRFNELEIGLLLFTTAGDPAAVLAHERVLLDHPQHWLANEILLCWKRVLKRIDMTSRSLAALIEPGSCFAGLLAELAFVADRSYMAAGEFEGDNRPPAALTLSPANFNPLPMANGLSRLETRFLGDLGSLKAARSKQGEALGAEEAVAHGLVTFAFDDLDWDDEIRIFLEERASFSPDALSGMEANLRSAGPETMETRIFGRLAAWQNWIFQRANAVGDSGALKRYGSGRRGEFDLRRV
jgi:benzoyl-CoA-dihydrodiol lyase